MNRKLYFGIMFLIILSSCFVVNIFPLYTPETLTKMPGLDGEWNSKKETWIFEFNDSAKIYKLTLISSKTEPINMTEEMAIAAETDSTIKTDTAITLLETYEVGIVCLNGSYFMDLYPKEHNKCSQCSGNSAWWESHHLRVHTISKLIIEDDSLQICMLNNDWVEEQLDETEGEASNTEFPLLKALRINDDQIILTGNPEALQEFCAKNSTDTLIFPFPEAAFKKYKIDTK